MKRTGFEVGLTVVLAIGALSTACRRPCGAGWAGCCPAPVAARPAPPPVASAPPTTAPEPVEALGPEDLVVPRAPTWLDKRIRGLMWEEVNLDAAVTYLSTITGKNFVISPKVREEKFEPIVLSLHLDDVAVKDVLGLITEPWDLRWEERKDVIWILTNEEVDGPLRLRYYDVKDLVMKPPAAPVKPLPHPLPERFGETKWTRQLQDELKSQVFPGYWDREDATLECRNGILIARAQPAVLHAIDTFLRLKRAELSRKTMSDAMQAKLEAITVSLSASNTTVGDLIKVLQIQTGMNLMIDPRFAADAAENPVSGIKLASTPLWTALQMLAAAAGEGAVWTDQGSVVMLTRAEFLGGGSAWQPVR